MIDERESGGLPATTIPSLMYRREAVRDLSLGIAALAGISLCTKPAHAQSGVTPDEGLRLALRLETLQLKLYQQGIAVFMIGSQAFSARELVAIRQVVGHDTAHMTSLSASLGVAPPPMAGFDFTGGSGRGNGPFSSVFVTKSEFFKLAQLLKDLAVRTYKSHIGGVMSASVTVTRTMQFHSVEARHAAQMRRLRGQPAWIIGITSSGFTSTLAGSGSSQADIAKIVHEGEDNVMQLGTLVPGTAAQATSTFDEPLGGAAIATVLTFFGA